MDLNIFELRPHGNMSSVLSFRDRQEIRKRYDARMTDHQIADETKIPVERVTEWRLSRFLQPN